ncbi:olfactory receptor 4C46-like [Tachyglossus aculeatus]|uniref:olfactory receptor 4C46-like n=1 Tax=Tachyglossus aculeatus TaxID=9261 RepID=UPI0018F37DE3|nr:olfactory receptor 4C46-like [Tachyglossus aculeatus]
MENENNVTEFILLGLTQNPGMQKIVFNVFLAIYSVTMIDNLLIITTITRSKTLGSPVYFFLTHSSFTDMIDSSSSAPRLIADSIREKNTISFEGCMTQVLEVLRSSYSIVIDHFMCDLYLLLKLNCSDTQTLGLFIAACSGVICLLNFILLMLSYVVILRYLKIHNLEGRLLSPLHLPHHCCCLTLYSLYICAYVTLDHFAYT